MSLEEIRQLAARLGHPVVTGEPESDGRFADGRTVNIRWYLKRDNLLDLREDGPDHYLVLTGPKAAAESSLGTRAADGHRRRVPVRRRGRGG